MARSYKKLWHILLDRGISRTQLRKMAGITTNALAKLGRDESLPLATLEKVCAALNCSLDDILDRDCGEDRVLSGEKQSDNVNDTDVAQSDNGTLNGTLSPSDDPQSHLRKLIAQNNWITRKQMAAALGISERSVQRLLNAMPDVRFTGGGRSGHWEITEKPE